MYLLEKFRAYIRRAYHPLIVLLFLWLLLTVINLIRLGHNLFFVAIAAMIALGFVLTFLPRYAYFGSLSMSVATVFFISLHIFQTFFAAFLYAWIAVFLALVILVLSLHYLTRTRVVLAKYTVLFAAIAYFMTTLLAFYMEGTEPGTDQWLIFSSLFSIAFLLLVPLNFSFRQHTIRAIVDISDLGVYFKISEGLKKRAKSLSNIYLEEIDPEIEKVVSELIGAVNSFLYGYYEGSIIHSYNVKEGLDRIFYDWMKMDRTLTFLEEEKEALEEWRRNIAHSNVRKPLASSKRREKKRKRQKKLENRYVRNFNTDYEKALNSIDFVMRATRYITNDLDLGNIYRQE